LTIKERLWDAYMHQEDETVRLTSANAAQMRVTDAGPAVPGASADAAGEDEAKKMLNGISAMPSMHVAMSMLFVLVAWNASSLLGVAFTVFAIVIAIGSVHLGWHYAVDGYVSAICMPILWTAAGRLVDWRRAREPHPDRPG